MKNILLFFILILAPLILLGQKSDDDQEGLFPLMKGAISKAQEMGIEFPKTYGLAAGMYQQNQKMEITRISIGDLVLEDENDFINVANSTIENTTVTSQFRADFWLLPFLNIYGIVGRVTTFNNLSLRFNLNVPPIPDITEGDLLTLERNQLVNINGTVMGYGVVLAGGYKKAFVNLNISQASTYLEELESRQNALAVFPMAGLQTKFANIFVGAIYLNSGQVNKGSFESEAGQIVDYKVEFESKQWNYNVGFNKGIGNWAFSVIQGFGQRSSSIIEVGYRF